MGVFKLAHRHTHTYGDKYCMQQSLQHEGSELYMSGDVLTGLSQRWMYEQHQQENLDPTSLLETSDT